MKNTSLYSLLQSFLFRIASLFRSQNKALKIINISKFISVDSSKKSISIKVRSSIKWTLRSSVDWIEFEPKDGATGDEEVILKFTENRGSPRCGKLFFKYGRKIKPFQIQQNGCDTNFDSPTHYFYITFGTLPALYAGLHALSHNKPTYFHYERGNVFNSFKFPPHIQAWPGEFGLGQKNMVQDMKEKILMINEIEPNAIFALYVDDLRSRIGYDWFVAQGIDPSRVKVTLLSDGTGTYHYFNERFGSADEQSKNNWDRIAAEVGNLNWKPSALFEPLTLLKRTLFIDYTWYMATLPDYRYFLQDPSLFESSNTYIQDKIKEMNLVKITPKEMLNNLSEERREIFFKLVDFDKKTIENFFQALPNKPNLIIIGTSPSKTTHPHIQKTIDLYAEKYNILYAVHPSEYTSFNFEKLFPKLKVLPQMPFEVFLWEMADKIDVIGGTDSSAFLSIPPHKIKFMYFSNPDEMSKPLNLVFRNIKDINWMGRL